MCELLLMPSFTDERFGVFIHITCGTPWPKKFDFSSQNDKNLTLYTVWVSLHTAYNCIFHSPPNIAISASFNRDDKISDDPSGRIWNLEFDVWWQNKLTLPFNHGSSQTTTTFGKCPIIPWKFAKFYCYSKSISCKIRSPFYSSCARYKAYKWKVGKWIYSTR